MSVSLGKYQLLRKIAAGGMGQIFLALERNAGIERLVVLKRVLPHLTQDEDFLEMFQEEAQLVAGLRHPNLITILEWTKLEDRHCLVMEYVQGEDARRLDKFARAQGKPLPVGLALRLVAEAAAGLHYAHQACGPQGQPLKLVHRDVSPQNILVGFDGGVKVIDFGVAKAAGSASHTATGVLKGKYPYMSPEQANGHAVDARSDLFALGVVLWELLTGRRLFKGESDMMTLRLVRDCQVPPPSQVHPSLPPELDALVLKALAPTPAERYPDCGAFRLAIEDFLLQHRMPASNAHLSAWLHELYAERIAHEANPAHLDQLAEDSDLDSQSNSSRSTTQRSQSQSAAPAVSTTPPRPAPEPRTQHTRSVQEDVSRRRPPVSRVATGLGLLLMLAGAAVILLRQHPPEAAPTPVPVAVSEPVSTPPPPPEPEPRAVILKVRSEPPGARVEVDGRLSGQTPLDMPLAANAPPVTLALRLEGYEPASRRVSPEDAPEVSVRLHPKPAAQKPPRRGVSSPPPPALDIKMGR
ncbi:serine/threonine protein kinase [Melittangium boletus]|uniref:Protein kinase n=1 Tax=Melittangium boletus DSM 14713 TaxID=1294270 RepID=A0A250IFH5_9BACT|nr:serine/threonine-protein kinase [Melittangium boletus]ATB30574.1 protein kinase [Melittangium boletus DSM 14713]